MACYHPIPAYQDAPGARVILWPRPMGSHSMHLPCGRCLGCRTDLATDWARRAELEARSWAHNCFVTLTYDDEHLPDNGHLRPKDLQKFLKRLRRAIDRRETAIASVPCPRTRLVRLKKGFQGPKELRHSVAPLVRFLASGEYGETTQRPHFHILLFNCEFTDGKKVGRDLTESPTLAKYWKKGGHRIGTLTGASANYVAQYSLKKLVTPVGRHDENGEVYQPPFIRMSLKPPIGEDWTKKYKLDLQHGYLVNHARKTRIPRAIKRQLAKIDPEIAELATLSAQAHTRTQHDLRAAEIIHERKNALTHARPL